jgi:hypothetical protein
MRRNHFLPVVVLVLLVCIAVSAFGQTSTSSIDYLHNSDVIRMVESGMQPGAVVSKILTSSCNFDIFPPVLRDLERRGVPITVLMAMKMAPVGPPTLADVDSRIKSLSTPARIPPGTVIEVETAKAVSSREVFVGSPITFLTTRRVFVNDVLVVERGAVARAHVVKVQRARRLGRAGMLAWEMDFVVGVDGTRIPITVSGKQRGSNRGAAIAGGALATGALVFPYSSPAALIWGLKKGDEAVLRGSRLYRASTRTQTEIAGIPSKTEGIAYRDRATVKASEAPPTSTNFDRSGFKPKGGFRSP